MNGSLQYSALTRLLTLNNQVHDLENQMLAQRVPTAPAGTALADQNFSSYRIAEFQEEIDQAARASLATCWLGNFNAEDEEYEL
ncbi:MAG: hypothetical protein FI717_07540 [SAR202 cluster bacterium]|nr:hypothetical protein [SAR202 cluster bacterium]